MWKQAFCVVAVFSAAIFFSTKPEDWIGALLLCALVALPVMIFCLLQLEPKQVKILHRGYRPYIKAARKRTKDYTCAYAGYRLQCPGCGCEFELTEKSRLWNLVTDDEWFHCIDCPECGHEVMFTSDDFFWAREIEGKSHEEIIDMMAERDRAKQASAEEKPLLEEEEPREVDQLGAEEEDEPGCYTGEDEPPKKDERSDVGGEGGVAK